MTLRQEIEYIRQKYNASVVDTCNALLLSTEEEYWDFIHNKFDLSIIQILGVMEVFRVPLESIKV